MNKFKTTIGLEVHIQLKTKSKMFCRCDNDAFGKNPNTTVCPVCLGMPGVLPVANEQAVLWTIKTGLALHSEINKLSKFDRKHYFYPDLPKGYQISQYDKPLCVGGEVKIQDARNKIQTIRLNRIHLEEDAGKLIHKDDSSFVDLNRAGTPLMEIVTEPDISSAEEAGEFLRQLQKIVRDIASVSEASMEKGHLRCDANIDLKDENGKMSPIVEIKNLNSFKFVEKALKCEESRLADEYENWPTIKTKQTRGFDSAKNITYAQREKEEASDYRYFPEPDIPPIDTTKLDLSALKSNIGQSEDVKIAELISNGVSKSDADVLANSMIKYEEYRKLCTPNIEKSFVAKAVVHNYFGIELEKIDQQIIEHLKSALADFSKNKFPKNIFQNIVKSIISGKSYQESVNELSNSKQNIDLDQIVDTILSNNSKEVERYKNGEQKLLGFFIGLVMKATSGKINPKEISRILSEKLNDNK